MNKRKELFEKETIQILNPSNAKKQKIGSLLTTFPKTNNDVKEMYKHFATDEEEDLELTNNIRKKETTYNQNNKGDENNDNLSSIPIESAIIHCFNHYNSINNKDDDKKINESIQTETKINTSYCSSLDNNSVWSIEITGAGGQRCSKNKYRTEDEMKRQLSKEIALLYQLGFKFVQRMESYFYLFERLDFK